MKTARSLFAILICISCLAACLAVGALNRTPVFSGANEYCLYLKNSSSRPFIATENPAVDKLLLPVVGESGVYEGDCAEKIIAQFHATVLFCEEVCGVSNYYCYSPDLGEGTFLGGAFVNLHIAVKGERTAVGTPLVFGGY